MPIFPAPPSAFTCASAFVPVYLAPRHTHPRDSELLTRHLNLPPDSREAASPGALGALLPAPSNLDETPEGTDNAGNVLFPIAVKLGDSSDMETDPSPDSLPVADATNGSPSPAVTKEISLTEPESPSYAAEGVGGAALSEEDDAPTQRSVVPTSGTLHTKLCKPT